MGDEELIKTYGVTGEEDDVAKAAFGTIYEAIRNLVHEVELKPWSDLDPFVQYLYCLMIGGGGPFDDHPAAQMFAGLISFHYFIQSEDGERVAQVVRAAYGL